jgi:hypothetical protein
MLTYDWQPPDNTATTNTLSVSYANWQIRAMDHDRISLYCTMGRQSCLVRVQDEAERSSLNVIWKVTLVC